MKSHARQALKSRTSSSENKSDPKLVSAVKQVLSEIATSLSVMASSIYELEMLIEASEEMLMTPTSIFMYAFPDGKLEGVYHRGSMLLKMGETIIARDHSTGPTDFQRKKVTMIYGRMMSFMTQIEQQLQTKTEQLQAHDKKKKSDMKENVHSLGARRGMPVGSASLLQQNQQSTQQQQQNLIQQSKTQDITLHQQETDWIQIR
jgi:hypothetical protein